MRIPEIVINRLANARRVVVFTGAGVSAESGVATFRDKDGLWSKFRPEELANVEAFLANPQRVWEWYQARRAVMLEARPNAGHYAIAALESFVPEVSVITQNIDGLHAEAGSSEVIELHGNIRRNFCQQCRKHYDMPELLHAEQVPVCECGGKVRPDVVWFGENLPKEQFALAEKRSKNATVFLSVGTSAVVYPAAGLPILAHRRGAFLVEINPEETPLTPYAHQKIPNPSGMALPAILELLRQRTEA